MERKFCYGVEEKVLRLTEGKLYSKRYAHHPACGKQYDLEGTINFSVPPERIAAGDTVKLHAEGRQSGYQSCCFVHDEFVYKGSCFSSKPKGSLVVNLRHLHKKPVPITIPDTQKANGWKGQVTNAIDVSLTMPKKGNSCIVSVWADGLSLKWTYTLETSSSDNSPVNIYGTSELSSSPDKYLESISADKYLERINK